jgi:hypothetical protein
MTTTLYRISNMCVIDGFVNNPNNYYLIEYFKRRPVKNEDILSTTESTRMVANTDFEILGTNASSDDVSFSSTEAGIVLTTDGADNDQVIVLPHLETNQSAWTGIKWGTENQVSWECAIRTSDTITTQSFWAGLKLTNTGVYTTDINQAYFLYSTDDDQGSLTTNANLHFVYSVAGTDYITDLGIVVAASSIYIFRIIIDSDRKIMVFVNESQYGLVTSSTAGGTTQSTTTQKSNALTNDINLIPYVGIQSLSSAALSITLCYEKISRVLFE